MTQYDGTPPTRDPDRVRFAAAAAGVGATVGVTLAYLLAGAVSPHRCGGTTALQVVIVLGAALVVPPLVTGVALARTHAGGAVLTGLAAAAVQGPMLVVVAALTPPAALGVVHVRCVDLSVSGVVAFALGSAAVAWLARTFVARRSRAGSDHRDPRRR